jgi:H+/Cl- antiporter ClcA
LGPVMGLILAVVVGLAGVLFFHLRDWLDERAFRRRYHVTTEEWDRSQKEGGP